MSAVEKSSPKEIFVAYKLPNGKTFVPDKTFLWLSKQMTNVGHLFLSYMPEDWQGKTILAPNRAEKVLIEHLYNQIPLNMRIAYVANHLFTLILR